MFVPNDEDIRIQWAYSSIVYRGPHTRFVLMILIGQSSPNDSSCLGFGHEPPKSLNKFSSVIFTWLLEENKRC